ncbi:MAG TPA: glycosyltransferase family 4 protein [Verrucomicrobiae bacterium]|nr:glycosyltransferase family 4 protein [Verrucomicrobiae bacterium]
MDLETEWRGGQSQALLLLMGLNERGHAAELVTAKGSPLGRRARSAGISVHEVSRAMLRLAAAHKIRWLLSGGRFHLLHANEAHALTAAWLAGAHRQLPLLSSRRIGFPLQRNWISSARFRALDRFVANSSDVARSLVESGFPADRIAIVNEGVEIPECVSTEHRNAARKRWGVEADEFLFGCASAFVPEKGQRHVVEALGTVREKFPNTRALLAGEGSCLDDVKHLAVRLDLQQAVLLPGFVTDMPEFYAALDAFVFPSEFEGLGTALQAAMAYGLPVISTTKGALGEVVEHGRTAIVAEPDASSFAAAMAALMSDSGLQKRLGEAGRSEVIERFSADRMVANTLAVYEELAGTGPGSPTP